MGLPIVEKKNTNIRLPISRKLAINVFCSVPNMFSIIFGVPSWPSK